MKIFITMKVGYSWSKMYGKTNEYFTTIIINENVITSISYKGMYGAEERVGRALKDKGYDEKYIPSDYGLMKSREAWKGFIYESEAVKEAENL